MGNLITLRHNEPIEVDRVAVDHCGAVLPGIPRWPPYNQILDNHNKKLQWITVIF